MKSCVPPPVKTGRSRYEDGKIINEIIYVLTTGGMICQKDMVMIQLQTED